VKNRGRRRRGGALCLMRKVGNNLCLLVHDEVAWSSSGTWRLLRLTVDVEDSSVRELDAAEVPQDLARSLTRCVVVVGRAELAEGHSGLFGLRKSGEDMRCDTRGRWGRTRDTLFPRNRMRRFFEEEGRENRSSKRSIA
jgi:hypothetical protein